MDVNGVKLILSLLRYTQMFVEQLFPPPIVSFELFFLSPFELDNYIYMSHSNGLY